VILSQEWKEALWDKFVTARMTRDTTEYWLDCLSEFDVPNAPILSIRDALEQPHVHDRGLIESTDHPTEGSMRLVRGPVRFDGEGPAASQAPRLLGEDTAKVLSRHIGLSDERINTLIAKGIVKAAS